MSVTPVLAAVPRQQPQEPWCRDDVIACACAGKPHTELFCRWILEPPKAAG